jgi:hypothetical protein
MGIGLPAIGAQRGYFFGFLHTYWYAPAVPRSWRAQAIHARSGPLIGSSTSRRACSRTSFVLVHGLHRGFDLQVARENGRMILPPHNDLPPETSVAACCANAHGACQ